MTHKTLLQRLKWLVTAVLALAGAFFVSGAHAQSTINTGQPQTDSALSSVIIRQLATAAASDINGILGMHPSSSLTTCPTTTIVGTDCLIVSVTPNQWYKWTGSAWGFVGTVNQTTAFVGLGLSADTLQTSYPLTSSFSSGVATLGFGFDSNFTLNGSHQLASANCDVNTLFGGPASGSAAEPGCRALVGADLPTPGASSLGGVESFTAPTHQFLNGLSNLGIFSSAQPSVGDLADLGSNVAAALADNVGSVGAFVVNGGALGTPSSADLANATGLPLSTGVIGTLGAANGGTGVASPTAHSLAVAEGANAVNLLTAATAGRVPIDQGSGSDPAFEAIGGDATLAANGTLTLATVNSDTGSFGSTTSVPSFTVNGKGLITAASANSIPTCSSSQLGLCEPDGTTITSSGGKLTAVGASATAITILSTSVGSGTAGDIIGITDTGCSGSTPCISNVALQNQSTTAPEVCDIISTTATTCNNGGGAADDGTYTVPSGAVWLDVELIGGGGGGGGSSGSSSGGAGTAGNPTCWNTTGAACTSPVYEAGGGAAGAGGASTVPGAGGAGGTVSGSGTCDMAIPGGGGGAGVASNGTDFGTGSTGGNSSLGGGAPAGIGDDSGAAGGANSGGGGAGGSPNYTAGYSGGGGGGAGATCRKIISGTLASSYTYAVAATAAGGTAGGYGGGAGAAGHIRVTAHFNN
jgi:hypothetical protein